MIRLTPTAAFVTPMVARAVFRLPEGPEWSYELKLDGYRALVLKDHAEIETRSRNDKNLAATWRRYHPVDYRRDVSHNVRLCAVTRNGSRRRR